MERGDHGHRTIGAAIHERHCNALVSIRARRNPYHAFRLIVARYPYDGTALMIWDSGAVSAGRYLRGNPFPPTKHTGPDGSVGNDPAWNP